eukprot:NODE_2514_length_467_cov_574.930622_g2076_i0.p2 GENE.NODE_2514_length_467_cov_574.930622_g2076_i0~~NODE_2514_length_467_cov_574.930622_g2076_i0.p2  ORF type:complete len:107 (+),score=7.88 NODE_2514_length_467_cov_574.930622_g2076_i0:40-360(+)
MTITMGDKAVPIRRCIRTTWDTVVWCGDVNKGVKTLKDAGWEDVLQWNTGVHTQLAPGHRQRQQYIALKGRAVADSGQTMAGHKMLQALKRYGSSHVPLTCQLSLY